tara:strand:+ start:1176 stop:1400 length:225 start_codon:yes stop_codon:yes gene_type:complete
MSFEQTFKNIDDVLYKDDGASGELDYIGQTSWVLFLKYLDKLEKDKADEASRLKNHDKKHVNMQKICKKNYILI